MAAPKISVNEGVDEEAGVWGPADRPVELVEPPPGIQTKGVAVGVAVGIGVRDAPHDIDGVGVGDGDGSTTPAIAATSVGESARL